MEKPYILHAFTTESNLSPFDVNMAMDAAWDAVIPYTAVQLADIKSLVQDAIFSRSPSRAKRTALFIGGRDALQALEMLDAARKAMVPPFAVSAMADPSGAFTTAAAMVVAVARELKAKQRRDWQGCRTMVLGGTGPVGMVAAILATELGAHVTLMSRQRSKAAAIVERCRALCTRNAAQLHAAGNDDKAALLPHTQVILATAAAGIQMMSGEEVAAATALKVVADVNAVPPSGIEGLTAMDNGTPLAGSPSAAVGIGALAIGQIKYQTQHRMLRQMYLADEPLYLNHEQAGEVAQHYVAEQNAAD